MFSGQSKDMTKLINRFIDLKIAYILIVECSEKQSWSLRIAIHLYNCKELIFMIR